MDIPLGFEVGSGEPVSIPLDHLIITGRTRRSGKTTTLEAIAQRAELRALTFLTKRGEDTFSGARSVQPYFHDQGGWRFVSSVLEATLGEKLKRERAEIINACKGTKSLREVFDRIVAKKKTAKSGWVIDVLTSLEAYLEIVLPQIERTPFAKRLVIGEGSNVIDLSGADYSDELRALIIRSALEWISKHESGVLTVIPEAASFIPQGRGNPVKQGCETLIRQGGVVNNWVAIDSQEITAVDKAIAKSCGVWILGVQRELNEVKRVIDQLPGRPKPTAEDVMQLGLGQFFVAHTGTATRKVYVQPVWMSESIAREVARGELRVAVAAVTRSAPLAAATHEPYREPTLIDDVDGDLEAMENAPGPWGRTQNEEEEEDMPHEALDRVSERLDNVLGRLDRMLTVLESGTGGTAAEYRGGLPESTALAPVVAAPLNGTLDEDALFQRFRARLLKDPVVLKVLATKREILVEVKAETITMDGKTVPGRIARLIAQSFFDKPRKSLDVFNELRRTGPEVNNKGLGLNLRMLVAKGFLTFEGDQYQSVKEMKVRVVNA